MVDMPASTGELAGAGLKGFIRGLIANFVGDGQVAGISLADIIVLILAYFMYKRTSGFTREFARGLFIKSVGDIIESFISGGIAIAGAQPAPAPQPQPVTVRPVVRRVVGGAPFR